MSFLRVRAVLTGITGLPGVMTAYFSGAAATPTTAEFNDATGRVRAFWVAAAPVMQTGLTVTVQQVVDVIDVFTGDLVSRGSAASAPAVVTGSAAGVIPPSSAIGLRLFTATVVGRRVLQGRIFLSPVGTTGVTNGIPNATAVTDCNAAGAALLTGATAISAAVWHRPTAGGSNGSSGIITSAATDNSKLWVLRSRRD